MGPRSARSLIVTALVPTLTGAGAGVPQLTSSAGQLVGLFGPVIVAFPALKSPPAGIAEFGLSKVRVAESVESKWRA